MNPQFKNKRVYRLVCIALMVVFAAPAGAATPNVEATEASTRSDSKSSAKGSTGETLGVSKVPRRPQNIDEAEQWFRKSAERGDAEAQYQLAKAYADQNQSSVAVKWYREAADQGHAAAALELAWLLETGWQREHGLGLNLYYKKSLYIKAAELGHTEAQLELGRQYFADRGLFLPRQTTEAERITQAAKWIRKAADKGHAEAQYELAQIYAFGPEGIRSQAEANKWYRKSAHQGHKDGLWALGLMYRDGLIGPASKILAYVCFTLSSIRGNEHALPDLLALELDESQQAAAQNVLDSWKPGNEITEKVSSGRSKTKPRL